MANRCVLIIACVSTLTLAGCDWPKRLEALEVRIDRLETELSGVSTTRVSVPTDQDAVLVFGNHSGRNATVTLTNVGEPTGKLEVQTRRISKPGDTADAGSDEAKYGSKLPVDLEKTKWLDMTGHGSRRELIVPRGYEIIARAAEVTALLALLIRY